VFIARREVQGYTVAPDGNYDGLAEVTRTAAPTHPAAGH